MHTVKDIIAAIGNPAIRMEQGDIVHCFDLLRRRYGDCVAAQARCFHPGDNVFFQDRAGRFLHGKVTRINRKSVSILVGGTTWKVSGDLLRKEGEGDGKVL